MFLSIFYFFLFCTRVKAQGASLFPWSSVVQRHVSALMLIQGRPSDLRISTGRGPLGPLLFSCGVPHVGVIVGCLLALGNIRSHTQWWKAIIPHACIPCSKTSKKYGAYWTLKYAAGPGTVCMRRVCVCMRVRACAWEASAPSRYSSSRRERNMRWFVFCSNAFMSLELINTSPTARFESTLPLVLNAHLWCVSGYSGSKIYHDCCNYVNDFKSLAAKWRTQND